MSFKNIRTGDRVVFLAYNGMGPNGPEFKEVNGRVNPLLIFEDHVVVNHGNNGHVVNADNYIRHRNTRS